jgi:hypothetical protein
LKSYVEKPCHEQASYLDEIERDPDRLRYRELVAAADCVARGKYEQRTIAERPEDAPPGWEIEQLNKARGLLAGEPDPVVVSTADPAGGPQPVVVPTAQPAGEPDSVVVATTTEARQNLPPRHAFLRRVSNLIPHALRGRAGSALRRAGSWLERD